MIITCYRTVAYKNIDRIETDHIWGTLAPDEMTDEDRQALRDGGANPMCCFTDKEGRMHCVPWQFVIEIGG